MPTPNKPYGTAIAMPDDFEPIDASLGGMAVESIHRRLDPERAGFLAAFAAQCPAARFIPRSQLDAILREADCFGKAGVG